MTDMWKTPDDMEDLFDAYCIGGDVSILFNIWMYEFNKYGYYFFQW